MTAFTTLTNSIFLQDKPITSSTGLALRDNPIAIAEADSTVANALRPTVILGTINTASGTTQTLSGLDLTPFRFLSIDFSSVVLFAAVSTAMTLRIAGLTVFSDTGGSFNVSGLARIALASGTGESNIGAVASSPGSALSQNYALRASGVGNATTSVAISCTGSGVSFLGGSVTLYGEK